MRLALIATLLIATPAVAGPCLVPGFAPLIVTPANTTIDQRGGVVVAAVSWRGSQIHEDVTVQAWEFTDGKQRDKAKVTRLAPGLTIYAPASSGAELDLEDSKDHSAVRVKVAIQPVAVALAPTPTAITHTRNVPMFRTESTIATLAKPPPAGTIALLVRTAGSKAALARSWILVPDLTTTSLEIFMNDRCEPQVPGTVPTRAGDKVELAWVDSAGHVSRWSKPIKVTAQ